MMQLLNQSAVGNKINPQQQTEVICYTYHSLYQLQILFC